MFKRILTALGIAAIIATAFFAAGDSRADTIGLHVASVHIPASDFGNNNYGLLYRTDGGQELGAYKNSIGRLSVYAVQQVGVAELWGGDLDVGLGVVSGYKKKCVPSGPNTRYCEGHWKYDLMPMIVPSYAHDVWGGARGRLSFIPGKSSVFHLSVEKDF